MADNLNWSLMIKKIEGLTVNASLPAAQKDDVASYVSGVVQDITNAAQSQKMAELILKQTQVRDELVDSIEAIKQKRQNLQINLQNARETKNGISQIRESLDERITLLENLHLLQIQPREQHLMKSTLVLVEKINNQEDARLKFQKKHTKRMKKKTKEVKFHQKAIAELESQRQMTITKIEKMENQILQQKETIETKKAWIGSAKETSSHIAQLDRSALVLYGSLKKTDDSAEDCRNRAKVMYDDIDSVSTLIDETEAHLDEIGNQGVSIDIHLDELNSLKEMIQKSDPEKYQTDPIFQRLVCNETFYIEYKQRSDLLLADKTILVDECNRAMIDKNKTISDVKSIDTQVRNLEIESKDLRSEIDQLDLAIIEAKTALVIRREHVFEQEDKATKEINELKEKLAKERNDNKQGAKHEEQKKKLRLKLDEMKAKTQEVVELKTSLNESLYSINSRLSLTQSHKLNKLKRSVADVMSPVSQNSGSKRSNIRINPVPSTSKSFVGSREKLPDLDEMSQNMLPNESIGNQKEDEEKGYSSDENSMNLTFETNIDEM